METFAPEFAQYWLASQGGDADVAKAGQDSQNETSSEQAALVELAERVSAARSVV